MIVFSTAVSSVTNDLQLHYLPALRQVPHPSQALVHVSNSMSSGRYHRLVGMVSSEVTHHAHTNWRYIQLKAKKEKLSIAC